MKLIQTKQIHQCYTEAASLGMNVVEKWHYLYKQEDNRQWQFSLIQFKKGLYPYKWELHRFDKEFQAGYHTKKEAVDKIKELLNIK